LAEANGNQFALEGEVDESPFARVTGELVTRAGKSQSFALAAPSGDSSKAELQKNRLLSSTTSLLVYKGEAEPSVIEAPPEEAGSKTDAIVASHKADAELRHLRAELAALRSTLQDRETALAEATLNHEKARESWQHENQAAEHAWKTAEVARLAEAKANWREQSASAQAEVLAQAAAGRSQADGDVRSLQEQLAALQLTLADRDKTLANTEQAGETAEAARLAEAEASGGSSPLTRKPKCSLRPRRRAAAEEIFSACKIS
jgi:hypothetical protein